MTELSKNAQVPQCDKTAVMPCFYHFDVNKRVYEKDGVKTNSPIYEEHFVKIQIVEENNKEYICEFGRTINKKVCFIKLIIQQGKKYLLNKKKEDDIYVSSKAYKLAELVRKSDANTLREVERLLSAK